MAHAPQALCLNDIGQCRLTIRHLLAVLGLVGSVLSFPTLAIAQIQTPPPGVLKEVNDKKNKTPAATQNRGGMQRLDPKAKVPITETIIGRVLKQVESKNLLLDTTLRVDGYSRIYPDRTTVSEPIRFETAAVIFPVPPVTSSSSGSLSRKDSADFSAEMMFDGVVLPPPPTIISGYSGGQQFYKWTATNITANTMLLKLKLPVTCSKLIFDEQLAMSVPWPAGGYPESVNSVMQTQLGVDYMHNLPGKPEEQRAATQQVIDEIIKKWTGDEDLKKLGPVHLAKFLAGRTMELLQPSGDGKAFNHNTSFSGFDLQGTLATLQNKKGSEYDIHCALTAIYRRVGIPARVIIGRDRGGNVSNRERFRSWVEFAIVDPISTAEVWVPVDIVRQRNTSSRAPALDRPWEFFGGIVDFQQVVPLSFHFHPPTTVDNAGAPCLWGWLTTPNSQIAVQTISMNLTVAPVRGEKDREKDVRK